MREQLRELIYSPDLREAWFCLVIFGLAVIAMILNNVETKKERKWN